MIVDFHTHIFPPHVRERRDRYVSRDPTFAEMYGNSRAKIATADDLLRSMDGAGVDVSVALGFAWRDHEDCVRHNDYLLEAARDSGGRIIAFCTVNLAAPEAATEVERCARGGARGLGELRPDNQGWSLDGEAGDALTNLAVRHGLILLFHVTEPAGHEYPGKQGLGLESYCRYLDRAGGATVVGAHLAGGLPLGAPSPPDRKSARAAYADTAALRYLYEPDVLPRVVSTPGGPGADRLLFGSDFPLVSQAVGLNEVRSSGLDNAALKAVLGANAERLLGLDATPAA